MNNEQKDLIRYLKNPSIVEANQDETGNYKINIKVNGKWAKRYFSNADVIDLSNQGVVAVFPDRWNPDHNVVVLAK